MQAYKEMELSAPVTQTVEAVKGLLTWRGRAVDPLPDMVELEVGDNKVVLVLSAKKDAYYTTTSRACSCPANVWRSGPCKHMRKHFPEAEEKGKPTKTLDIFGMERKQFQPFLEAV